MPQIGDMCLALFEDGCYYRAQVKLASPNVVKVFFLDFGNMEETQSKNLLHIPDSLKKVPCCAVRVTLKDVPRETNNRTVAYFSDLTTNNTELEIVSLKPRTH